MFILPISSVAAPVISKPVSVASLAMPEWLSQTKGTLKYGANGRQQVLEAYKNRQSDVLVENVSGTVEAILSDDLEGSRHQRFIIRITSGHTVLVVHNMDLAPRIDSLREGDRVTVKGEYEWNERGGLIHWTHHDPRNVHEGGWIEHSDVRYE